MKYLLLLLALSTQAQIVTNGDLSILNDLPSTWTIGNGCEVPKYIDAHIYGDLTLKGDCFILNARLTVHGYVIYNGYSITISCDDGELIEAGYLNINEVSKDNIKIYPNPASDVFYVETKETFNVSIYSIDGKLVGKSTNIESLSKGIYLVVIKINNLFYSTKLIKQ